MLVDTALKRTSVELSNAVSTSAWKPLSGEWVLCRRALETSGFISQPCYAQAGYADEVSHSDELSYELQGRLRR